MEVALHAAARSSTLRPSFFSSYLPSLTRYSFGSSSRASVAGRRFWTSSSCVSCRRAPSNSRPFLTSPFAASYRSRSTALLGSALSGERHYAVAPLKSRDPKQQQQQQPQQQPA